MTDTLTRLSGGIGHFVYLQNESEKSNTGIPYDEIDASKYPDDRIGDEGV